MFWSLKTLVEQQLKTLVQSFGPQAASWRPAVKMPPGAGVMETFHALQNGGRLRIAASGSVAMAECLPSEETVNPGVGSGPDRTAFQGLLEELEIPGGQASEFPERNPITLQTIDWAQEISRDNLEQLSRASLRQAKAETLSQNAKLNRLVQLLYLALRSGNISLAMILFSHLEAATANEVTRCLIQKVQTLQENKRKLAQDLQKQKTDAEGSKNMQKIKTEMEQTNDDIAVLQTFIRDVAQNKQSSLELANAFISKEHETTMAIVRSFGR